MKLNVKRVGPNYQAILQTEDIEILGPCRDTKMPIEAVNALAEMFIGWTNEIPATLPDHKGWLSVAAALKARVALSENPDQSA